MTRYRGFALATSVVVAVFLFVQLGALALVDPLKSAGLQPVENPQKPVNSLVYVAAILVMTGVLLAAFRYDVAWLIRGFIVATGAYIGLLVFSLVLPPIVTVPVAGGLHGLAWAGAIALAVALYAYPEWYVLDAAGVIMGTGAAGLFGITFGVLPALVLLVVLAVYDAISVYGTEHMLTVADGVMDLKVPVVLVAPTSFGYSFLDDDASVDGASDDESSSADDRDALFIGLGDAIIPTVLVASVAFFADPAIPTLGVGGFVVAVPAITAAVGTFAGLAVLLWLVLAGRAHAGLPLLNGGAIAGYLVGALASGMSLIETLGLGPYL